MHPINLRLSHINNSQQILICHGCMVPVRQHWPDPSTSAVRKAHPQTSASSHAQFIVRSISAIVVCRGSKRMTCNFKPFYCCCSSSVNGAALTETTYNGGPAVADFPVTVLYPQTASIHMLPLAGPNYNVKIIVIGGSSKENADPYTPASNLIWTLDFSTAPNLAWTQETMSAARVMPDGVLLPDGNVLIVNGGEVSCQPAVHSMSTIVGCERRQRNTMSSAF